MQTAPFEGARLAALQQTVQTRRSAAPDSFTQDTYDQTVTYLLSSQRSSTSAAFLLHDAIRDARKHCARLKRRHQTFVSNASVALSAVGGQAACCGGATGIDPEALCLAADLESRIRSRVAAHGQFASSCLAAMLDGQTVLESARSTGRPVRTVERMRAMIRAITRSLVASDLAA